jgi:hypothetical protein
MEASFDLNDDPARGDALQAGDGGAAPVSRQHQTGGNGAKRRAFEAPTGEE